MIVHRAVPLDPERVAIEETLQAFRAEGRILRWALTRIDLLELVLLL